MEEQYDDSADNEYARELSGVGWFLVSLVLAFAALGVILGGQLFERKVLNPGARPTMRLEPKPASEHR